MKPIATITITRGLSFAAVTKLHQQAKRKSGGGVCLVDLDSGRWGYVGAKGFVEMVNA